MISKSETEITKNWMVGDRPDVSICCTTFNHEDHIAAALDGFLMQQTDFPYEIIIRDDCSADDTAAVIKLYVEKYPKIIKPIYESENQYSKGVKPMPVVIEKATGKFLALCEGDDYWTDPKKLQRQYDFLKDNSRYSATADNAWVEFDSARRIPFSNKPERDLSLEELAMSRQCATGALMFRAFNGYPETLKNFLYGDTPLILYLVMEGGVRYFDHLSSVYRRHCGGMTNQIGKSKENTEKVVEYIHQLDQFLSNEFTHIFNSRIAETYFQYAIYCFPNNIGTFVKYLRKASKYDPGATFVSFLKKFLLIDRMMGKLASRYNNKQVFMK